MNNNNKKNINNIDNKLNEDTKNSMKIDLFKHRARRELWASILWLMYIYF